LKTGGLQDSGENYIIYLYINVWKIWEDSVGVMYSRRGGIEKFTPHTFLCNIIEKTPSGITNVKVTLKEM
jgi:hypothetical protein